MTGMDTTLNAEYIQKRCFDLLVWTLQHFTSKLQHFFLTYNRTFQPYQDEVKFWDTGYRSNDSARQCAEKIKKNIYHYWQERYQQRADYHKAFIEMATEILDPTSRLCQALDIGGDGNEEYLGLHIELIGRTVSHIISTESLTANDAARANKFNFQDLLTIAATDHNAKPKQYKQIKYSNLIAVLNYTAQKDAITETNIHIYLAEYIYARLSSFKKKIPSGFIPILLPLRGLGQWRAMAGWICPNNRQLKEHLKLVRRAQPESLILAVEELYSVNLIEAFIFLLEDVLSKITDATQRTNRAAAVFSQLWIADEIRFYRENSLVLHLNNHQAANNQTATISSETLSERAKLLVIEEDVENNANVILNLNKHEDVYLLRRALGFDLVVYRNCTRVKLDLPGQEEYWEVQFRERLSRTAAAIIKEQYFLTQGLTHEIMNTLSRRSRYRVLYAKALNNIPVDNSELLYTCSILQELYHLTDAIRTVTKFDDPRTYLLKLINNSNSFDLTAFASQWQTTLRDVVQQILYGINHQGSIPVYFHQIDCRDSISCQCQPLPASGSLSQIPTFPPFSMEATSLFLVGVHEALGNSVQYITKQQELKNRRAALLNASLTNRIDIDFQLIAQDDRYYQLKISNPVQPDEKPRELSDGLKRTQSLLSCFVFRDRDNRERRLVEFSLTELEQAELHSVAIRFRPQLVFAER